jgi:hypothetical protein
LRARAPLIGVLRHILKNWLTCVTGTPRRRLSVLLQRQASSGPAGRRFAAYGSTGSTTRTYKTHSVSVFVRGPVTRIGSASPVLLVCSQFTIGDGSGLPGLTFPLHFHTRHEWLQRHRMIKGRPGQVQGSVVLLDSAGDRHLDTAEIVTTVRCPGELLGPAVEIRQALITKIHLGCRILSIRYRPDLRNPTQRSEGRIRPCPTRPQPVETLRGQAHRDARPRRPSPDGLIEFLDIHRRGRPGVTVRLGRCRRHHRGTPLASPALRSLMAKSM